MHFFGAIVIVWSVLLFSDSLKAEPSNCKDDFFLNQVSNFLDIAEHLETRNIANLNDEKIPWIGRVVINDSDDDTNWCTGTLIRENVVLTAKHCLTKGLPKYFCYQAQGLSCTEKLEIESEVKNTTDTDADFVFLKLKSELKVSKFPQIKVLDESVLLDKDIFVIGYHNSNMNNGGEWALMGKCKFVERISDLEQKTDCYTRPGSSGGPIVVIEDNAVFIVGVTSKYYLPIAKILGLKGSRIVPAATFKFQFDQFQKEDRRR